jgi:ribosomal protein S21
MLRRTIKKEEFIDSALRTLKSLEEKNQIPAEWQNCKMYDNKISLDQRKSDQRLLLFQVHIERSITLFNMISLELEKKNASNEAFSSRELWHLCIYIALRSTENVIHGKYIAGIHRGFTTIRGATDYKLTLSKLRATLNLSGEFEVHLEKLNLYFPKAPLY